MADKRISELPNLSSIEDSALLVVEFNNVAYNLTGKQFKDFAKSVAGSGGSGGGLPSVTTADNGKFLRVVNGAWAAESLPSAEGGSF